MPSPNEVKKGTIIKQSNELWAVVDFQRVSPGKGSSFVRVKMKSLASGKVQDNVFKSAETLEFADVAYKKMQFLFSDEVEATFMDSVSYDQIAMSMRDIGDDAKFLKEGLEVSIAIYNDNPVAMVLPLKIQYKIMSAPPAVKGDTASGNVTKEVELENGMKVNVPIFIKEGEIVVLNTGTGEYVERVNS
jgi:elongation factor P